MRNFTLGLVVAGALTARVAAQPVVLREPTLPKTTVGSELYRFYCSNCHGLDAKGRPATASTRTAAPDLTVLSIAHGGRFPREAVRNVIVKGTGKATAHGTTEMPVWGTIFRAFEPDDVMVDVRIDNLVRYLESVQASSAGTSNGH
ncbi:MAG TPA: c-type cytochrome [Vicinamibacterales bacterium]|nr:c-type cytochrome [Vicinamibacterales bacterium]